jgi:(p)ppGpp synthase/HD superfamily hydrolase
MLFPDAFAFACRRHAGALKKGTSSPFLYHPLAVASLVLKYGGDETQAVAALLHDTIADEDCPVEKIAAEFGEAAARLVAVFADPPLPPGAKPDWQGVRQAYLEKLAVQEESALLVVACEELHELTELMGDLRNHGASVWQRYPVPAATVYWYFRELMVIFHRRLQQEKFRPVTVDYGHALRRFKDALFDGRPL